MKILDISMEITPDMPVYGGNGSKRPLFRNDRNFRNGSAYETRLEMNLHTGTHIDAPMHMIEGGGDLSRLKLEQVVTPCRVLDLTCAEERITREHLAGKVIEKGDFILLKTKNSFQDILEGNFIFVDKTGAEYLKDAGIKGVGIDSLGIERSQPGHETHKTLLGAGIVILEGLRLKDVDEGEYHLFAAPIRVLQAEAAPVRAFLLEKNSML